MTSEETGESNVEKIGALNEIFEDVISDATELIKDLYWSVKMYLFFWAYNGSVRGANAYLQHGYASRAVFYSCVCGWDDAVCWCGSNW
jgi:hypothetical protein